MVDDVQWSMDGSIKVELGVCCPEVSLENAKDHTRGPQNGSYHYNVRLSGGLAGIKRSHTEYERECERLTSAAVRQTDVSLDATSNKKQDRQGRESPIWVRRSRELKLE